MQIVYNPERFKSREEWEKVNSVIGKMDSSEAHDYLVENGYIRDTRLKVKDMIRYLQTLNPEANLVYGEQNGAMLGEGYWQHMVDFMLPQMFVEVGKEKKDMKRFYVQEERMTPEEIEEYTKKYEESVAKDFKYVKDGDIIVRI